MADKFPTSVRLPSDIKKELQAVATAQRRSLTWIIVEVLRQWVNHTRKGKK